MYYCDYCELSSVEKEYCFNCEYCAKCCICHRPKFFNGKLTFHTPTRSQKKYNKSPRFISAEIEVAGIKKKKKLIEDVVKKWNGGIVYDGTLPRSGFEINTAPAGGDLYVKQITNICDALIEADANSTVECGLHVHIDARDFNYCDLYRLVKIYAVIEPALFSMVPAYRHSSIYAIKCGNILESSIRYGIMGKKEAPHIALKQNIVQAVYGTPDSSYRTHKRGAGHGTGRYYALNLHSWFHRGTVECRLFDGTLDKNEIINWGVLWAIILDFALHSSEDEISVLKKNKSYESLIHIVKDNEELKTFISNRYNKYVNQVVKQAKSKTKTGIVASDNPIDSNYFDLFV